MTDPRCVITLAPSGQLCLEMPSILAPGRTHYVEIPLTLAGLSLIKRTLMERKNDPTPSIGKRSAPVTADIQKYLAGQAKETRVSQAQGSKFSQSFLDSLDIDL